MFRKALAILLVGSWVLLSAIDLLEDLDLANHIKIHTAKSSDFAGFGRTANVANNLVENGTRHIAGADLSLSLPPTGQTVRLQLYGKEAKRPKKNLKLYKLRHALLI